MKKGFNVKKIRDHRTRLQNKLDFENVNVQPFCNVTVVIATDETFYPLSLFDALKVIQCVALVSFFSEIFMVLFEVEICLFPTFQETVWSHPKFHLISRNNGNNVVINNGVESRSHHIPNIPMAAVVGMSEDGMIIYKA